MNAAVSALNVLKAAFGMPTLKLFLLPDSHKKLHPKGIATRDASNRNVTESYGCLK